MPLRTLQSLLVLGALAWALLPKWGGLAFAAVYLLLALSVLAKRRSAGKLLRAHEEKLGKAVTAEAVAWGKKHPFFYVWPEAAKAWGLTLRLGSLLMLILGAWFVFRGIVFVEPSVWLYLLPAAAVFWLGVLWGPRLDLDELTEEKRWKEQRPLHDELKKVLTLQALAGQWSPGEP